MRRMQSLQTVGKGVATLALLALVAGDGRAQGPRDGVWAQAGAAHERGRAKADLPAACRDLTAHKSSFVRVDAGVWLEVLEWGGERNARTMVLLTGLGDNAHVYDQFAQQFTDSFRVIGITRRGFAPSSRPTKGYDVETRARDDIAVLDALRILKATFVGHSLAGSELAKLGELYGDRVDKLVFLDAADLAERFLPSRAEPPGPGEVFTSAALRSLSAYQAASARYTALRKPDAAVCSQVVFGPRGEILDSSTPDWVSDKLLQGVSENPRVDWARIGTPRLGIFAPFTLQDRQPWYWYLSAAQQAQFDQAWPPIVVWHAQTIDRFANGNATPTLQLPGAPHYVYINNEAEVVREMRNFLGLPVGGH